MQLGEVVPHQYQLTLRKNRQVEEIHPAHCQFHRTGDIALVVLAIPWNIVVTGIDRTGGGNLVVGPSAVHIAIEHVRAPGSLMLPMAIRGHVARIGYRHMPHNEDRTCVDGVGIVFTHYEPLHARHRCIAAHVMPDHGPSIPFKVHLQLLQLHRQRGAEIIIHEQDDTPPIFHHGQLDARIDIRVTGPTGADRPDDLVFIGNTHGNVGILPHQGACIQGGHRAPPACFPFQLSPDLIAGHAVQSLPAQLDLRWCRLYLG